MSISRNFAYGLTSSVWSAVITITCVPIYIHYLGIEAYGLIGFFVSMQALLQLLDMGLSPTVNREVARCVGAGRAADASELVHSLSCVNWALAAAIVLLVTLLSGPIAHHWLRAHRIPESVIEQSIALMGVVIACRWPIALYQGVLLGATRVGTASVINIVMATLANGGAIVVLAAASASIEAFFIWQASVGLLHVLSIRHAAWRALQPSSVPRFNVAELRRVGRFAIGMSGVAVSGVILAQTDKVILSRLLPLSDFGHYALAGVVASGLYLLLTPMFNVIYPRLSALVARNDVPALVDFYRTGSRLFAAVLFPVAATAGAFSLELLTLWTRDPSLAASAAPIATLFLVGTALNGAMHFPYALQLAHGVTWLPLTINGLLLLVAVPLTISLTMALGAIGGALAWAVLNFFYLLLGTWLTHRQLLRGLGLGWLVFDVVVPASVSVATAGAAVAGIRPLGLSAAATLLLGIGVGSACIGALVMTSPRTRQAMRSLRATLLTPRGA